MVLELVSKKDTKWGRHIKYNRLIQGPTTGIIPIVDEKDCYNQKKRWRDKKSAKEMGRCQK